MPMQMRMLTRMQKVTWKGIPSRTMREPALGMRGALQGPRGSPSKTTGEPALELRGALLFPVARLWRTTGGLLEDHGITVLRIRATGTRDRTILEREVRMHEAGHQSQKDHPTSGHGLARLLVEEGVLT